MPTAARLPQHPIDPLFTRRWSPRAFTGEAMSHTELMHCLEAARWAPSAYNLQPWRFIYALRGDKGWDDFLAFTLPFNQACAVPHALDCPWL